MKKVLLPVLALSSLLLLACTPTSSSEALSTSSTSSITSKDESTTSKVESSSQQETKNWDEDLLAVFDQHFNHHVLPYFDITGYSYDFVDVLDCITFSKMNSEASEINSLLTVFEDGGFTIDDEFSEPAKGIYSLDNLDVGDTEYNYINLYLCDAEGNPVAKGPATLVVEYYYYDISLFPEDVFIFLGGEEGCFPSLNKGYYDKNFEFVDSGFITILCFNETAYTAKDVEDYSNVIKAAGYNVEFYQDPEFGDGYTITNDQFYIDMFLLEGQICLMVGSNAPTE